MFPVVIVELSVHSPRVIPVLREQSKLCFSWTEHAQLGLFALSQEGVQLPCTAGRFWQAYRAGKSDTFNDG